MKRIFSIVLVAIMFVFTWGCAAEVTTIETTTLIDQLSYSMTSLTYTKTNVVDMLYNAGNPDEDFAIFSAMLPESAVDAETKQIFSDSLSLVLPLSSNFVASNSTGNVYSMTTADFNDLAVSQGVTLTISDVVLFNQGKEAYQLIAKAASENHTEITRQQYIEYRLHRLLTEDEIEGCNLFQKYYAQLNGYYTGYLLSSVSSSMDLKESFIYHTYAPPTTEELALMALAYPIIDTLRGVSEE
ncbi:MAG: hypothetical protein PHP32_01380 [Candidatus Izemoplasmatales bacterium]|nr:hypothetical protein [Candidatus Izemoplasmatales bacterium]